MSSELAEILYTMPRNAPADVDDLTGLHGDDIPWERVPSLKEILKEAVATSDTLRAATLLAYWGDEAGVRYLEDFVCNCPTPTVQLMPHRLEDYDDVYTQVLRALIAYWANRADAGAGEEARAGIAKAVLQIIRYSNAMPFEIAHLFWLVERHGFTEYLPALKVHLVEITKQAAANRWKIADCAHLLVKFDPTFVDQTLSAQGLSLNDFAAA